jgi:hypothetical protein
MLPQAPALVWQQQVPAVLPLPKTLSELPLQQGVGKQALAPAPPMPPPTGAGAPDAAPDASPSLSSWAASARSTSLPGIVLQPRHTRTTHISRPTLRDGPQQVAEQITKATALLGAESSDTLGC